MAYFEIQIDKDKFLAQPQAVRQEFQTNLFCLGSELTSRFGAHIDWSDTFHWKITCPDGREEEVKQLLPAWVQ